MKPSNTRRQRGAALILTIVVIVVLTTLGLAMVTFTGIEERTASTYRDAVQVRGVAEAGIRLAQQMFRDPGDRRLVPEYNNGTLPGGGWDYYGTNEAQTETTLNAIGIFRSARTGATPARYTGAANVFFDEPFNTWASIFGGAYTNATNDVPDLEFRTCGLPTDTTCWLNRINNTYFATGNWQQTTGVLTRLSFYAPPIVGGQAYGIATIRATAEKRDLRGNVIARETMEAIIGMPRSAPAIMADGDIKIESSSEMCGNGCENIHANGNITIMGAGNYSGGNPPLSATGTIATGGSSVSPAEQPGAPRIPPPQINPWDTIYRPTGADLNKYYLLAARQLDSVWRDGNGTHPPDFACGVSMCQDYNLEYVSPGTTKPARSAGSSAYLYKWNVLNSEWDQVGAAAASGLPGGNFTIGSGVDETLTIQVWTGNDIDVAGTDDGAAEPFIRTRVPVTVFRVTGAIKPNNDSDAAQKVTLLVDGCFWSEADMGWPRDSGSPAWKTTIIAAGSIYIKSSANVDPAMSNNRIMFISGRDIRMESSFNNAFPVTGFCPPNLAQQNASAVIAAHEQVELQSSGKFMGIIVAENDCNYDNARDYNGFKTPDIGGSTMSNHELYIASSARHSYQCGMPDWPWALTGLPMLYSLKRAGN